MPCSAADLDNMGSATSPLTAAADACSAISGTDLTSFGIDCMGNETNLPNVSAECRACYTTNIYLNMITLQSNAMTAVFSCMDRYVRGERSDLVTECTQICENVFFTNCVPATTTSTTEEITTSSTSTSTSTSTNSFSRRIANTFEILAVVLLASALL